MNVGDFTSHEDLADYLKHLTANPQSYEALLSWKKEKWSDAFNYLLAVSEIEPKLRLAVKLAHDCGHHCGCGGRIRVTP